MSKISQKERYKQSLIKYAVKYGVAKAAARYATNRQYVYRWMKRYDGSLESLRDKSRRPHHHSNEHSPAELLLIRNMLQHKEHRARRLVGQTERKGLRQKHFSSLYRTYATRRSIRCLSCVTFPPFRYDAACTALSAYALSHSALSIFQRA